MSWVYNVKLEGAEHAALGGSAVQHQRGGGATVTQSYLGSVCEEVQYPFAECGTQAQSVVFQSVTCGEKIEG